MKGKKSCTFEDLERANKSFKRTLNYLQPARRRLRFGAPVSLLYFADKAMKGNLLSVTPETNTLIGFFRGEIRKAVKSKDAMLAALLGIILGHISAELGLSETVSLARTVKKGGSKGGKKSAKLRKSIQDACNDCVSTALSQYARKVRGPVSLTDFREIVIRPLIDSLYVSKDPTEQAVGMKLMGTLGNEGDGIMSSRQLQRMIRRRHRGIQLMK